MIDYWQMIFFNLFFTSLPPLVFGILDKDISAETLLALPELYKRGQNSEVRGPGRRGRWPQLLPDLRFLPGGVRERALGWGSHSATYLPCDGGTRLPVAGLFLICC